MIDQTPCLICASHPKNTVVTNCEHFFCYSCLDLALARDSNRLCPFCYKQVKQVRYADQEFEIEDILDHKNPGAYVMYLVLWADGSKTWEPWKNLNKCQEILKRYKASTRARRAREYRYRDRLQKLEDRRRKIIDQMLSESGSNRE